MMKNTSTKTKTTSSSSGSGSGSSKLCYYSSTAAVHSILIKPKQRYHRFVCYFGIVMALVGVSLADWIQLLVVVTTTATSATSATTITTNLPGNNATIPS